MCGICGYIGKKKISDERLATMRDTMVHRGPDDSGFWQGAIDGNFIGIAHRRLSVLDLSDLGHQPMHSEDNRWHIVFNGEIYNYKIIREELKSEGFFFQSECDTEVVLKAYMRWGKEALCRLEGMYAFAIVDTVLGEVFCARDCIGKKPLYYYWDGKLFIFASELKAIAAHPEFHKVINQQVLAAYLCYQYINEPDTIYENVYKLPAGNILQYKDGRVRIGQYWSILDKYEYGQKNQELDYLKCRKNLKDYLYQSVEKRLMADVPVGTFLSGGIDSTLVTAIANDIVPGVKTFTIGFDDKERNEAPFAKETAAYLGTEHQELYVTERDMLDALEGICTYFDEPFADPSEIPTMLVSKLAREKVTVALSGDGGDEFFCGYSMYDYIYYAQKLDKFAGIGNMCLNNSLGRRIKKALPDSGVALLENRDESFKTQLFIDLPAHFVSKMLLPQGCNVKYKLEKNLEMEDWQERRMLLDMYTYLPEDVLTKADRASMKYSLEMRCPLLDRNVMEYSFRIPHKYKYNKKQKKYILKDILCDYIPREMMERPKNGFGVPLGKWLRIYLKNEILRVSSKEFLYRQNLFDYEMVMKLIQQVERSDKKPYPKILWAYYIFQIWYEENFSF